MYVHKIMSVYEVVCWPKGGEIESVKSKNQA